MIQSKKPLIYNFIVLVVITIAWIIQKYPFFFFISLSLGFIVGSLILELDHLVYWYILDPKSQESQIAQKLIKQKNFKKLFDFYLKTKAFHQSLIFHHFYTQIALIIVSIFILTSAETIAARSIIFFTGLNLFFKQALSFIDDKNKFRSWLFARMPQQLSIDSLIYYLLALAILNFFFLAKMIGL